MLRPPLTACVPTGVTLGAGTRVVVMRDEGGVGDALVDRGWTRLGVDRPGVDPGHRRPSDCSSSSRLARRRRHRRRVLARRARRRGPASTRSTSPAGARPCAAGSAPLRRRCAGSTTQPVPRRGHPARRLPRLRRRRRHRADGRRGHRVRQVVQAGAARRAGQGRRLPGRAARRPRSPTCSIDETLRDPGCVEVGHADGRRWGVGLAERPFPAAPTTARRVLGPDRCSSSPAPPAASSSAITADLAASWRGTFHLLDLTPEPDPADPDLRRYVDDRDGFKTDARRPDATSGGSGRRRC